MMTEFKIDWSENNPFLYLPRGFTPEYLEAVFSQRFGQTMTLRSIAANNLCQQLLSAVSCSGATILKLELDFEPAGCQVLVAKILSPDAINLFKPDLAFDSRVAEIEWARWWGAQPVLFRPHIYDTHIDLAARELWILEEYFPQIGWAGTKQIDTQGRGVFSATNAQLETLFTLMAEFHAFSHNRETELRTLFSRPGVHSGYLCPLPDLLVALVDIQSNTTLLDDIGVTTDERRALDRYIQALAGRPAWVDEGSLVCVTADWKPDNLGLRDPSNERDLAPFDFGAARLAPLEEDLQHVLGRLIQLDEVEKSRLTALYLQVFQEQTDQTIDAQECTARLPWARFTCILRSLAEHAAIAAWTPYQERSKGLIRLFLRIGQERLDACLRA